MTSQHAVKGTLAFAAAKETPAAVLVACWERKSTKGWIWLRNATAEGVTEKCASLKPVNPRIPLTRKRTALAGFRTSLALKRATLACISQP